MRSPLPRATETARATTQAPATARRRLQIRLAKALPETAVTGSSPRVSGSGQDQCERSLDRGTLQNEIATLRAGVKRAAQPVASRRRATSRTLSALELAPETTRLPLIRPYAAPWRADTCAR